MSDARLAAAQEFIAAARSLVGTRFHHGGRLPGVGIDCIGVPACAGQVCGFEVRDVLAYPMRPNGMLRQILAERLLTIRVHEKRPADVLLMAFDGQQPHHLAVYTGDTIIHAHVGAKKCVEQAYTSWWVERTFGVFRFAELA